MYQFQVTVDSKEDAEFLASFIKGVAETNGMKLLGNPLVPDRVDEELEGLLGAVRTWLTEEKDSRIRWCRACKLELLVGSGMVTAQEADAVWTSSEGH